MLVTLSGTVMLVKAPHPEKANSPMCVTLAGIVTLVSPEQKKANSPMRVTPSGIVIDVAGSLFIYKFLLLAPFLIKLPNPLILHHAAISVIYMS